MKRADLVKSVSERFEVTQVKAKEMVEVFEEILIGGLQEDGEVPFMDGKFKVAEVKAQEAKLRRNPSTGETFMAEAKPASQKVVFKAGSKLKELFK